MSDHIEHECGTCGSFLHHEDRCPALPFAKEDAAKAERYYVAGFMFSPDRKRVALIRKQKPLWQAGKLNGIGGKVEPGEVPSDAMAREFEEETGWITREADWKRFCRMGGVNDDGLAFYVDFFATTGEVDGLESREAEKVELVECAHINPCRTDVIENLAWLIALALDFLHDGRPRMVTALYGNVWTARERSYGGK